MRASASVLLISAALSGCGQKPPTDHQIKAASIAYIESEDLMPRLTLLFEINPGLDSTKMRSTDVAVSNLVVTNFRSAGCAKSQQSAGFVCTVQISAAFDRPASDLWPKRGFATLDGPYLFHLDETKYYTESDGWEIVSADAR